MDRYASGYWDGQAIAYCEQVRSGSRVAGQLSCEAGYAERLSSLIASENCQAIVEKHADGRTTVWIYREDYVKDIIEWLQSIPQSKAGAWGMGKLLGYSDSEIANYIQNR